VNAFLKLFSMVCGPVPLPRIWTMTSPTRPTTVAETLYPLALQSAIAVVAMVTAASAEMSLLAMVCENPGAVKAQATAAAAMATRDK
jgi:hypothetical protein